MDTEKEKLKREFKIRMYKYIIRLLRFLTKLPYDAVLHEIKKQVTKSGTSMGANYFEAEAASSKKDYQNYFSISLKSGNETRFWLAVLLDSDLTPKDLISEAKNLLQETTELANILAKSIITMKGKRK